MFGSAVGFSGTADRMSLFPVLPNPRWRLGRSNCDISAADHPIYSVFGSRVGFGHNLKYFLYCRPISVFIVHHDSDK